MCIRDRIDLVDRVEAGAGHVVVVVVAGVPVPDLDVHRRDVVVGQHRRDVPGVARVDGVAIVGVVVGHGLALGVEPQDGRVPVGAAAARGVVDQPVSYT